MLRTPSDHQFLRFLSRLANKTVAAKFEAFPSEDCSSVTRRIHTLHPNMKNSCFNNRVG